MGVLFVSGRLDNEIWACKIDISKKHTEFETTDIKSHFGSSADKPFRLNIWVPVAGLDRLIYENLLANFDSVISGGIWEFGNNKVHIMNI